ncbi:zinc finger protein [Babesia duncani]|uniref:Zinc finger protein n=1 Tax=Babesia duncani TaxID=323732 RepID=A0AAD9PJS5_9APIC|nr:zinc finger protein [Babesia duncani]KAK2195994.1 zinc finger protein [Babesia duncani]
MTHRSHRSRSKESRGAYRKRSRSRSYNRHSRRCSRYHSPDSKHRERPRARTSDHSTKSNSHSTNIQKEIVESGLANSVLSGNLNSEKLRNDFEADNYAKAYGIDVSGFVGLTSELLQVGMLSKPEEKTKEQRRLSRKEEIRLHPDRFWKCKKCSYMNYQSNYFCMGCNGLKQACAL